MEILQGTVSAVIYQNYENGYSVTFDPIEYFTYTSDHLIMVWLVLLIFVLGAVLAAIIGLYGVRKDSR